MKRAIGLTCVGDFVEGLYVVVGTSVEWNFLCLDPASRVPIDLIGGGAVVTMSLSSLQLDGDPVAPPIETWTASLGVDAGTAVVEWPPAATAAAIVPPLPDAAPLPLGIYLVDLWITMGGDRIPILEPSILEIRGTSLFPGGGD